MRSPRCKLYQTSFIFATIFNTPNRSDNEYHFPHKLQTCRNSEILVAEDTSEEDAKIIHLGIRIDTFNQTRLFQQGNLCGSVLEVCCNVNKGKHPSPETAYLDKII